jgi:hypothetical protein
MAGLLDDMKAAQAAKARGAMSHRQFDPVTGRQFADAMQAVGLLASPIPVVGDVAGLLGDAAMYAAKPEERTLGNFAMTALGALPFVPSVAGKVKLAKGKKMADLAKYPMASDAVKAPLATRVYHGSTRGPIVGDPQMWPHRETEIQNGFSVTTDRSIAERYARGEIGMHGPGPNPTVSEFLLFGRTPEYREAYLAGDKAYAARKPKIYDYVDRWLKENGYVGTKFNDHNVKEIIVTDPDALIPYPNKSRLR